MAGHRSRVFQVGGRGKPIRLSNEERADEGSEQEDSWLIPTTNKDHFTGNGNVMTAGEGGRLPPNDHWRFEHISLSPLTFPCIARRESSLSRPERNLR